MGLIASWNDAIEDVGEQAYEFTNNFAGAVRTGLCSLYDKYPRNFLLTAYGRGFLRNMCNERPPGGDMDLGFGRWRIELKYQFTNSQIPDGSPFRIHNVFSANVPYVGSIESIDRLESTNLQLTDHFLVPLDGDGAVRGNRLNLGSGNEIVLGTYEYLIYDATLPYDPDPVDPGDRIINIDILTDVSSRSSEVTNVDIEVFSEGDTYTFPTQVDIGGDTFNLDFDGISTDSGGEGEGGDGNETSNEPGYKKPFTEQDFTLTRNPVEEEEELEEIEEEAQDVTWVLVDVTTLPAQGKQILHSSPDDLQMFAGWFCWVVDAPSGKYRMPEEPLRKKKNAFLSPREATGYSVFTINNARIRVTKYTPKE